MYIKKSRTKIIIIVILAIVLAVSSAKMAENYFDGQEPQNDNNSNKNIKQVQMIAINSNGQKEGSVDAIGTVYANSRIDIVALSGGMVKNLSFDIGDEIGANQILARLNSDSTSINYLNAQTNYYNSQNSFLSVEKMSDDTVKQAEISVSQSEIAVQNALQSIATAKIGLKDAEDNLANSLKLQEKNDADTKENAVIAFDKYLNFTNNALNQINYIIGAENGNQMPHISNVLGVKNSQSLRNAENSYMLAKNSYLNLSDTKPNESTILDETKNIVNLLSQTELAVNDLIFVLKNTIAYTNFSASDLNNLENEAALLFSGVIDEQTEVKTTLNGLENLEISNKQNSDIWENSKKTAESQLNSATISYESSLSVLESAKQSLQKAYQEKEKQKILAQISVDNAKGQLDLYESQLSDLIIKAPINGTVTGKFIDLGAEVNPGQKIAEISQIKAVKIKTDLDSNNIYKIKLGDKVIIRDNLSGIINFINPVANDLTKKVEIEILFDNANNDLIAGSFVDVSIPIQKDDKPNSESIFIPLSSVNMTQNGNFVFIVGENDGQKRALKTEVGIGEIKGTEIEIISGLKNNDLLIIGQNKDLKDGEIIEVL